MITITKEGNLFRLRLKGIRTKFYAKNPKEIAMAVTHYYLSSSSGHHGYDPKPNCPLCRLVKGNKTS